MLNNFKQTDELPEPFLKHYDVLKPYMSPNKYLVKFCVTVTLFIAREQDFFSVCLPKIFYEKLFLKLLQDSKEKIITDFIYTIPIESQSEVFDSLILPLLSYISIRIPITMNTTFYPMIKDLYIALNTHYKALFD